MNQADFPAIQPPIVSPENLRSLVEPSDKIFATEYAYFVLSQMTTCHFNEADRLGKRKGHTVGFRGMACRYCYGSNGSGRFFPLTLKTFSDVSKSLHVLSSHLKKCPKCPNGMASKVNSLSELHEVEKVSRHSWRRILLYETIIFQPNPFWPILSCPKVSQSFGSQKVFFELIWKRLHPELYGQSPPPLKSEECQPPPVEATVTASVRGGKKKTISTIYKEDKHPTRECFIPKKRYCMQLSASRSSTSIATDDRDHGLPPLYPTQRQSSRHEYSETDVSVAMILATGFDRKRSKSDSPVVEEA